MEPIIEPNEPRNEAMEHTERFNEQWYERRLDMPELDQRVVPHYWEKALNFGLLPADYMALPMADSAVLECDDNGPISIVAGGKVKDIGSGHERDHVGERRFILSHYLSRPVFLDSDGNVEDQDVIMFGEVLGYLMTEGLIGEARLGDPFFLRVWPSDDADRLVQVSDNISGHNPPYPKMVDGNWEWPPGLVGTGVPYIGDAKPTTDVPFEPPHRELKARGVLMAYVFAKPGEHTADVDVVDTTNVRLNEALGFQAFCEEGDICREPWPDDIVANLL